MEVEALCCEGGAFSNYTPSYNRLSANQYIVSVGDVLHVSAFWHLD